MPNLPRLKEISSGFTLIELLVVVAIIAILAVVSLALFGNVQKAARDGVRRSNIDTLAKNLETRFDYGSSLYQQLDPNDFSEGVIPKDPDGSSYNGVPQSATASFQLCAALDNHPLRSCNSPSQTCFCKSSMRGDLASIGVYNGTFHPVSCDPNGTLDDGLVGYWKMDETTSPFLDYSGNNNTGTWVGGVGTAPGVRVSPYDFKNAGSFDGSSGYMNAGSDTEFNNLTVASWEMWVNSGAYDPADDEDFFDGGYWSSPYGPMFYVPSTGNNFSLALRFTDGSVSSITYYNFTPGQWYHIVAIYDGNKLSGYINGSFYGDTTPGAKIISHSAVSLGGGAAGRYWDGFLDDVRIYNRALSPQEVSSLYNSGDGCIP